MPVPAGFWRKVFAFAGPGYLVAVGYMDPGNWATDIAGGARYGYTLLSVVMISNLMAILLQAMAARLGIAAGRDLAQACRDSYSRPVVLALWVLAELAIAATDLAEVLGAAIALNLLFGLPDPGGRRPHRARRPRRPLPAAAPLPLRRGARRPADSRDCGGLRGGTVAVASGAARCARRVHPDVPHPARQGHALYRARHPRRDGHAAQPVPALLDRADAQVRRQRRRTARAPSGSPRSIPRWRSRARCSSMRRS